MLIFAILLILSIAVASVLSPKPNVSKDKLCDPERINLILRNIEVYDGTPKGQKRLEDLK